MFVYVQVCALTNGVHCFRLLYEGAFIFFGLVDASKIRVLVHTDRFGLYMRNYSLFNRDEYYYQQYINDTKRI